MLNFLNPAFLIATAAALIPLLIHLFSRRKVRVIEFSSLKHLKEMQKRQVRRIKIRQLLLLLLRMLIVLVAVLAFARPASKGGYIGSHAGVSSVILFDRSASMQRQVKDGQLFDLARTGAEEILKNFGESDELIFIPFDRQTRFPAGERFFSADVAGNILDELTPGYDAGNFQEAFNKAAELLSGAGNLNKELYLITDRQRYALPDSVDSLGDNVSVYFMDLPVETDGNCGIVDIDMGGQLISLGTPFSIGADIQNYDSFDKPQLLASLFIDGIRVMQTEFAVEASGRQSIRFKHTVNKTGLHYGWVELSDDAYLSDNRYYFSFRIPDRFNVLIIDGDGSGDLIRLALNPSENLTRYWSVKTIDPGTIPEVEFREYDVIVLNGLDSLPDINYSQLMKFVDEGGGLFYVLGQTTDPGNFNAGFGRRIDLQLVEPPPASFTGAGYYTMERFDYTHPIFSRYADIYSDSLPTFRFFALAEIDDGSGNRDLAFFSNGAPALVESSVGLGRIITLTAPLSPRYTDLSVEHNFFPPFIIRTMEYLAGGVSAYESENFIGKNVRRSLSGRQVQYGSVELITPDNRAYTISGTEQTGQIIYDCRPIDIPGIYQLKSNDRLIDLFPVNLPQSESDLAAADFDQLRKALKLDEATTIPYNESAETLISEARFGRELWKIFLWAAAVLMLVEMLLARESEPETDES